MKGRIICMALLITAILVSACHFRRGSSFIWSETGDTVNYLIAASGSGRHVLKKVNRQIKIHNIKKDDCRVIYVSDSASVASSKSILLFNSVLPDISNDMLTKGFIGTFGSRQVVTYLVVTQSDFEKYFTPHN